MTEWNTLKNKTILIAFLILDLGFVVLHFLLPNLTLFNLDRESNLPTVYQGLKLLFFGGYILFNSYKFPTAKSMQKFTKVLIYLLGTLLVYLGIDELAQIHENVPLHIYEINSYFSSEVRDLALEGGYDGSIWVVYYLPFIILFALPLLATSLYIMFKKNPWLAILGIIGLACLIGVPFIEAWSTGLTLSPEIYNLLMSLEEGFEMVGVSLLGYSSWIFFRLYLIDPILVADNRPF